MGFNITIARTDKQAPPVVRDGGDTLQSSMIELGKIIVTICDIYGVHGKVYVEETDDELSASRYLGWYEGDVFKPFIIVTLSERTHA